MAASTPTANVVCAPGIEVEELFDGEGKSRKHVGRVTKVRFSDRIRRLELLGKHVAVKAFQDQIAVTGLQADGGDPWL